MRLIDADPLLEQMKRRKDYIGRPSDPVCLVEDAPTVDAVPVVRCKDCIYGTEMSGNIICHQPKHNEYETDIRSFDWFCANGERREGDV